MNQGQLKMLAVSTRTMDTDGRAFSMDGCARVAQKFVTVFGDLPPKDLTRFWATHSWPLSLVPWLEIHDLGPDFVDKGTNPQGKKE